MMQLCCDVLKTLQNKTLVTAESLTGGGIGAALTAVPGSSEVYKGGIISYRDEVKEHVLGVPGKVLKEQGAVSAPVALAMAEGVRKVLSADIGVSVTGLAGPGGDEYGNPVGTVFIGYCDEDGSILRHFCFIGTREEIREQTIQWALALVLERNRAIQ